MNKCNFHPKTFAQAEAGCPLDHAPCGSHIVEGDGHEDRCKECKFMAPLADEHCGHRITGCGLEYCTCMCASCASTEE